MTALVTHKILTIEENILNIATEIVNDCSHKRHVDTTGDVFNLLDRNVIFDCIRDLISIIYPGYYKTNDYKIYNLGTSVSLLLENILYHLSRQIAIALNEDENNHGISPELIQEKSYNIALHFLEKIPEIRSKINDDIDAAMQGDPAAFNVGEIIVTYPGVYAITIYRLAHELYKAGVPLIPRCMSEYAHSKTGIDIHPGAEIGRFFFIDHGTGVVIGQSTIIGNNVKIYQGVTLGAVSTHNVEKLRTAKRHPTIEDNVTIYSNASILGGNTVIGHHSVIGGNTFITKSIPPYTRVCAKNQELTISELKQENKKSPTEECWYYTI